MTGIGAGKLSVVKDTNKQFENSQPYFTKNGKYYSRRSEDSSTMVTKGEHKILHFMDTIVSGRFGESACNFEHMVYSKFDNFKLNHKLFQDF